MKDFYIVQYNDCYGWGLDKTLEVIVESGEDFELWLEEHNKEREADGNSTEGKEEFDLIHISLFEKSKVD